MPPRRRTNYAAAANRKAPTPATTEQIRTKDVRITVDLEPALHAEVKNHVRQLAADAGRDVPLAVVARALFSTWLTDPALAQHVQTAAIDWLDTHRPRTT